MIQVLVDTTRMLTFPWHRQIVCSDAILLNKADLVSDDKLTVAEGTIRRVNPSALRAGIYRRNTRPHRENRCLHGSQTPPFDLTNVVTLMTILAKFRYAL